MFSPISLYIHWPFCLSKCPYCDFNSHVRESYEENLFEEAIIDELQKHKEILGNKQLKSIFFGGGTPSLMRPKTVANIIEKAVSLWDISSDLEITLEANPNSVEVERFQDLAKAGVNRFSIGIQSLYDKRLQQLGRKHSAAEALRAIAVAQQTVKRVSIDLIYATPGQTLAEWEAELKEALAFGTEHLSLYQLTIESGTAFETQYKRKELILPTDTLATKLYILTEKVSAEQNLLSYEVSNYARKGSECRHNLAYWRYQEYMGIGPGAHGRLSIGGQRYATYQYKTPEQWLKQKFSRTEKNLLLSPDEVENERILMGLRLTEGIFWEKSITAKVQYLIDQGFLKFDGSVLSATLKGRLVLQSILSYVCEEKSDSK